MNLSIYLFIRLSDITKQGMRLLLRRIRQSDRFLLETSLLPITKAIMLYIRNFKEKYRVNK